MHLPATMRATCLARLIHFSYICRRVQATTLLTLQSSPAAYYFPPFGPNILLTTLFSNTLVSDVIPIISETKFRTQSHEKSLRNVSQPAATLSESTYVYIKSGRHAGTVHEYNYVLNHSWEVGETLLEYVTTHILRNHGLIYFEVCECLNGFLWMSPPLTQNESQSRRMFVV
jgi:hypothetical protein